jgi:hypothetical protein
MKTDMQLDGAGEGRPLTRRTFLQRAAGLGLAASTLGALDMLALTPVRDAIAAKSSLPEIQFQIERFGPHPIHSEGVTARMPPVYTAFATFTLTRTPTAADQATLAAALEKVESSYPFSPSGVFTTVAYGIPYFERLPGGMAGPLAAAHMPRLLAEQQRYALEEAVPGPTDVSPLNPGVSKLRFQVPVQIEANDVLVTVRSDSSANIDDVLNWLAGSDTTLAGANVGPSGLEGLLEATSRRLSFTQVGLPRKVAEEASLDYAGMINPASPMWMGFVSQQVGSSGPAPITTFLGNSSARLTTARGRDYFNHGSIVHLSHAIIDLEQFYARPSETYVRREAAMFSADPLPRQGNADPFTNGGGPAFVPNVFNGPQQAEREAEGTTTFDRQPHIAHTTALQRSSRAPDRAPMHIRADGPGFDSLDVPDGSQQPKLHFAIYLPTADFFAMMRRSQASTDLAQRSNVPEQNQGIERFLTATRRQNFLVPPRRNRAFPLVELA